jgi:imidazolonepropionase-like amidohydrolase
MPLSLRAPAVAIATLVCAAPISLAAQRHVPATYAITGARIVPVSGPVIDKGTIVIRDGIITAVGSSVATPADARVIDGTGLSIYPGLIDAYTSLAQTTAAAANTAATAGGRGGRSGAATTTTARAEAAPNSNYVTGLRPEVDVVNELEIDPAEFDAAHSAGVTTAMTAVPNGIFRGAAAVIDLDGDSVADIVLKGGVAQSIGFSRGGGGFGGGGGSRGGYPGTLFGAFASLRQELLDAQHYRDVKAAYVRNPRAIKRPAYDASLEALQPVISHDEPVILQANTEREIIRALDLAKEFNLKAGIAGGAQAYLVADRLAAEHVPVILTLNFPRAGAAGATGGRGGGGGRGGASADDPEPLRMLRDRVMAPKGPAILAKAGVRFAFTSGADYTDMLPNVRKAIAAGLPADEALRALTVNPADLFNLSDRIGSIETGKIANLTISKGDLLAADGHVSQLFVDGAPVDIPAAPANAGGAAGGRGGRPGADVSGRWSVNVSIDGVEHTVTLFLRQDEDRLYGVVEGDLGSSDILSGEVDWDGTFAFTATLSFLEGTADAEFDGSLDRTGMHGSLSAEDHNTGSFAGSHAN